MRGCRFNRLQPELIVGETKSLSFLKDSHSRDKTVKYMVYEDKILWKLGKEFIVTHISLELC